MIYSYSYTPWGGSAESNRTLHKRHMSWRSPTRGVDLPLAPFPTTPRRGDLPRLAPPSRTHAWSSEHVPAAAQASATGGGRTRGWKADRRRSAMPCVDPAAAHGLHRRRRHGRGRGRAGHRSSEPRGAGVEGEGRRRGRGGEERRGEGGRIRPPPWLGARRARIRPQPELATSIRASPAAPARRCARGGRAGEGRRRRRVQIRPAAEGPNPTGAGARRLDSSLAGCAYSPAHAGRASRGGEEAAEDPNPAGAGARLLDPHLAGRACSMARAGRASRPGR